VNGDITLVGLDTFRIPVAPDVSFRFAKDDTVLLRRRTWGQPLRKFDSFDISGTLIITEPPEIDAVVVRAVGTFSAQSFPSGSLLFKPKPAPASVLSVAYPYAEMVAKNIKDAITTNNKPLVDVPGPNNIPQIPAIDNEDGRTAVADFPTGFDPNNLSRIVGLYAGGGTFVSGIFHPTGQCMMRGRVATKDEVLGTRYVEAEFCAVCRYILVDLVAPEFHPQIDADYDKFYPQQ